MDPDDFDLDDVPEHCSVVVGWTGSSLCEGSDKPISGLCESYWDCGVPEYEEYCFTDDELYRAFLKARAYQLRKDWRRETLTEAARGLFGPDAFIVDEAPGVIRVSAGRALAEDEKAMLHLFRQVLPVAPGIRVKIVSQVEDVPFFGFGVGWGGICEGVWAEPT